MQIRLDPDNARAVKRNAEAHRRIFKRKKPYACVVNEWLRELLEKVRTEQETQPGHD